MAGRALPDPAKGWGSHARRLWVATETNSIWGYAGDDEIDGGNGDDYADGVEGGETVGDICLDNETLRELRTLEPIPRIALEEGILFRALTFSPDRRESTKWFISGDSDEREWEMRTRVAATILLGVLVSGVMAAAPASAGKETKIDLLYDCGPKTTTCPAARDMLGPEVGFVNYNQNGQGDLIIVVAIKRADPDHTYNFSFYCGPTHATAGPRPYFELAAATTNTVGNGNTGAIKIDAALLTMCGTSGEGHVDMDSPTTTLAATPVHYVVP